MLKIKQDIDEPNLKIADLHFVKSDYFHSLEVVDQYKYMLLKKYLLLQYDYDLLENNVGLIL